MNLIPKKIWSKTLVRPNSKIKDVVRSLSRSSLQICLVVSTNKTLIGTITDGDIRRALLRGLTLKSSIKTLIKKKPFVITSQMDRKTIKFLMESKSLLQAPQVDEKFKVVGFHLWKDFNLPKKRNNVVIIMAGGFWKKITAIYFQVSKTNVNCRWISNIATHNKQRF